MVHYAKNQPKEEQEEQREKEARIEMKMILKTIKPNDNLDDNEIRVQNKKLRRIKAAKDLYRKSDERIIVSQMKRIQIRRSYVSMIILDDHKS
ncbi:hypothetical protein GLOIN_2v1770483 [Rhizophagus irregularis DAOM 181602=DAOM 197198]|nr:hypothetical protein GLOIN_2v1770483 [Rhizophagus irregularis DAOM 181602=DAOM 197198]